MASRFAQVSPGAAATEELVRVLAEREAKKRQDFLDALTLKRENRNDEIQRANLEESKQRNAALNEQRNQTMATGVAGLLKPGQAIDPNTADTLKQGNLGILVQKSKGNVAESALDMPKINADIKGNLTPEQMAQMEAGMTGKVSDIQSRPTQTSDAAAPGVDQFTGTPGQLKVQEDQKRMHELASKLQGVTDRQQAARLALDAGVSPAQVDDVVNTYMGKPEVHSAIYTEWQDAVKNGYKGGFTAYQNEDANRKRPVTSIHTGEGLDASPAAMMQDVKDVLNGLSTLYNIRLTMGRSDKAAAYMQRMRAAIKKEDPNFDFVASDAGGKAVSSSYYQRGIASVNAVMPNLSKIADLSREVDRIGVTGIDALLQRGAMYFGDKKVTSLHQARKLLADEIGAALGAGSASDMKLQLGFDVTDPSVTDENFAQNIGIVMEFLNNRKKGLESLRYKSTATKPADGSGGAGAETPEARAARLRKAAGL